MKQISLPLSFLLSVGIALVFLLSFGFRVLAHSASPEPFAIIDNIGQSLGWLLAALLCLVESPFLSGRRPALVVKQIYLASPINQHVLSKRYVWNYAATRECNLIRNC